MQAQVNSIEELAEKVAAANARRVALQQRSNRIFEISSPARMREADPPPTAREMLDAVAERDKVQAELIGAVADVDDAQRALAQAKAAAQAERVAEIRRQQAPLVRKLDEAFKRAEEINSDIAALDVLAEAAGAVAGHARCQALDASDPFCTPVISAWREHVRSLGLLS